MKQEQATEIINGVDIARLFETAKSIHNSPNLAVFRFRLSNDWLGGGRNKSTVQNFYGAGEEDSTRKQPFVIDADEPEVLLGSDEAPNPVEYLLHALAACVTTSMVYHAAAKGIRIKEVESRVEGKLDLRGFLGLSEDVSPGYENIQMRFKVKADVPDDELADVLALGPKFSPVFDSVTRPVAVSVSLDRDGAE
ncbi:MAG TPA: OsmC family protein [Pyrinomonadaceae bacterium]|nr:OsmC family protein [Pyrinomonadaceae bacterium]